MKIFGEKEKWNSLNILKRWNWRLRVERKNLLSVPIPDTWSHSKVPA